MKVKTVHYKRIKNLGNYESETFEMTADFDDDDDIIQSAQALQDHVHYMLGIDPKVIEKFHYSKDGEKIRDF